MDSTFKKAYQKTVESVGGSVGAIKADENKYVNNVQSAIDKTVEGMEAFAKNRSNSPLDSLKGFIAEDWHAGTYNIDAARQGLNGHQASAIRQPSPGDIRVDTPEGSRIVESKYWKTPEKTATELSHAKYDEMAKVGPSDQLDGIKEYANRQALRNQDIRPEKSDSYQNTAETANDRITVEAESTPLSHEKMRAMAKDLKDGKEIDPKKYGITTENYVTWNDVFRESGEAAANAAILTAVLKSAPHIWHVIKDFVDDGTLNKDEIKRAGYAAVSGSVEGGLRGGIAAAVTTSCKAGLLGEAYKNINPTVVGAATVVAMNAVSNSFKLYNGDISGSEFAEACLRDSFVVSAGVWGATIGQGLVPVPILGAVIGNLIGSTIATFVYEGSKEFFLGIFIESGKPFLNIVKQDYSMPRSVLEQSGFNLIQIDKIELDLLKPDLIVLDTIELDMIDIKVLKRGLIAVNTIGYLN